MQPNCPSGEERGETVTDRRQRWGITRPAQAKRGRMGRPLTAPAAHAKGLVLTAKGVADPRTKKREKSARQGWHQISARDGSRLAETATGGFGSRQPDPWGAPDFTEKFKHTGERVPGRRTWDRHKPKDATYSLSIQSHQIGNILK